MKVDPSPGTLLAVMVPLCRSTIFRQVASPIPVLILSNCVVNLSPDKTSVFEEAFRVLKAGGRLAISDILALAPIPQEVKKDLDLISACIGGAATVKETEGMLTRAGFVDICIRSNGEGLDSIRKWDPKVDRALEFVSPAAIEAVKPKNR